MVGQRAGHEIHARAELLHVWWEGQGSVTANTDTVSGVRLQLGLLVVGASGIRSSWGSGEEPENCLKKLSNVTSRICFNELPT